MLRMRRGDHPVLLLMTLGTLGAAIVNGDVGVALVMLVILVAVLL